MTINQQNMREGHDAMHNLLQDKVSPDNVVVYKFTGTYLYS